MLKIRWTGGPAAMRLCNLPTSRTSPSLLLISDPACHWYQVMAHESFEYPTTAKIMKALFINIKVDREERPDD